MPPSRSRKSSQNSAKYQPMVDRNYQRLLEVGTWDVRVKEMLATLKTLGYDV